MRFVVTGGAGFIGSHIVKLLLEKKDHYSLMISREMGKPIKEAKAEIEKCSLLCDYYYKYSEVYLKSTFIDF